EAMIGEFSRMAGELDREIALEEKRAGITDPNHFAYPTYAKAATARRDNLKRSKGELEGQLAEAKAGLDEAIEEFRKVEALDGREKAAERLIDRPDLDLMAMHGARA
ncbi:MAG: flagellar export protein FliJ, partial [Methylobacteriaceae bacterium]|nr:flagellar export protein FliJ [Methylobacteriaceae bacterium]